MGKREWRTEEVAGEHCTGWQPEREREHPTSLEREREKGGGWGEEEWISTQERCLSSYFSLQLCEAEWATERREHIWASWKQRDHVPVGRREIDALAPRKSERLLGRPYPKRRKKITQGKFESLQLATQNRWVNLCLRRRRMDVWQVASVCDK